MGDIKILNITKGDSQSDLISKLNSNFSSITSNLGGAGGFSGIDGYPGPNGLTGPTGPVGNQGIRGNRWKVSEVAPTSNLIGDLWVDTANDCLVSEWDGESWVSQDYSISQRGLFEVSEIQTGLTSGFPNKGYIQTLYNPERKTLILTGNSNANVRDPQLSKILIGNSGSSGYPLLEFSKTDYITNSSFNSKTPAFFWKTTSSSSTNSYGLVWRLKNGIDVNSASASFKAGTKFGVNIGNPSYSYNALTYNNRISLTSTGNITLQAGTQDGQDPKVVTITGSVPSLQFTNLTFICVPSLAAVSNTMTIRTRAKFYSLFTTNTPSFLSTRFFNYKRIVEKNPDDNFIRVKFSGDSSFTSPGLKNDSEFMRVNAEGMLTTTRKISSWYGGQQQTRSGTFRDILGNIRNFYTYTLTNSWVGYGATNPNPITRISFNEFCLFIKTDISPNPGALVIHLPIGNTSSVRKDGLNLVTWPGSGASTADNYFGIGQSIKIKVWDFAPFFGTWNCIILDTSVTPRTGDQTSYWNFTGGTYPDRIYDFMDGSNLAVSAKYSEIVVTRVSQWQFMLNHESIVSSNWSSTSANFGYRISGSALNPNF